MSRGAFLPALMCASSAQSLHNHVALAVLARRRGNFAEEACATSFPTMRLAQRRVKQCERKVKQDNCEPTTVHVILGQIESCYKIVLQKNKKQKHCHEITALTTKLATSVPAQIPA